MNSKSDFPSDSDNVDEYANICMNQFESQNTPQEDTSMSDVNFSDSIRAASVSRGNGLHSISSPSRRMQQDIYDDDSEMTQWNVGVTSQASMTPDSSLSQHKSGVNMTPEMDSLQRTVCHVNGYYEYKDDWSLGKSSLSLYNQLVQCVQQEIGVLDHTDMSLKGEKDSQVQPEQKYQNSSQKHICRLITKGQRARTVVGSETVIRWCTSGVITDVNQLKVQLIIVVGWYHIRQFGVNGVNTDAGKHILRQQQVRPKNAEDLDVIPVVSPVKKKKLIVPKMETNASNNNNMEDLINDFLGDTVRDSHNTSNANTTNSNANNNIPVMKETPVNMKNNFLAKWRTPKKEDNISNTNNTKCNIENSNTGNKAKSHNIQTPPPSHALHKQESDDLVIIQVKTTPKRLKRMASLELVDTSLDIHNSHTTTNHYTENLSSTDTSESKANIMNNDSISYQSMEPVIQTTDDTASVLGLMHEYDSTLVDAQLHCSMIDKTTNTSNIAKYIPCMFLPQLSSLPISKTKQCTTPATLPAIPYNATKATSFLCSMNNRTSKSGPNQDSTVSISFKHPIYGTIVLLAVADGHGEQGEVVSMTVSSLFPALVQHYIQQGFTTTCQHKASVHIQQIVYTQQHRSMQYHSNTSGDLAGDCGTTLACALIYTELGKIVTYSIGDSRIGVYGQYDNNIQTNIVPVSTKSVVPKPLTFFTHEQCLHTSQYEYARHMQLNTAQRNTRKFDYSAYEWQSTPPTKQIPMLILNPSYLTTKTTDPVLFHLLEESPFLLAIDAPVNKSKSVSMDVPVVKPVALYITSQQQQCFVLVHPLLTHTVGIHQGNSANTQFVSNYYSPRKKNVVPNVKYDTQRTSQIQLEKALQYKDVSVRDMQRLQVQIGRQHASYSTFDNNISAFQSAVPKQVVNFIQVTRCLPGVCLEEARVKKLTLSTPRSLGHGVLGSSNPLEQNITTNNNQPVIKKEHPPNSSLSCPHGRHVNTQGGVEYSGVLEILTVQPGAPYVVSCVTDGVTSCLSSSALASLLYGVHNQNEQVKINQRVTGEYTDFALAQLRKANATVTDAIPVPTQDNITQTTEAQTVPSLEQTHKHMIDTALQCSSCIESFDSVDTFTHTTTNDTSTQVVSPPITLHREVEVPLAVTPLELPLPTKGSVSRLQDSVPQHHAWQQYHKESEQTCIVTQQELYFLRFQKKSSFPLMHETCAVYEYTHFLAIPVAVYAPVAYVGCHIAHISELNIKAPDNASIALLYCVNER